MTIVTRLEKSEAKRFSENEFYRYVILLRFKGVIAEDDNDIICTDYEFSTHQENLKELNKNIIIHNGFYHGHYFKNLKDAILDYNKRCSDQKIIP